MSATVVVYRHSIQPSYSSVNTAAVETILWLFVVLDNLYFSISLSYCYSITRDSIQPPEFVCFSELLHFRLQNDVVQNVSIEYLQSLYAVHSWRFVQVVTTRDTSHFLKVSDVR